MHRLNYCGGVFDLFRPAATANHNLDRVGALRPAETARPNRLQQPAILDMQFVHILYVSSCCSSSVGCNSSAMEARLAGLSDEDAFRACIARDLSPEGSNRKKRLFAIPAEAIKIESGAKIKKYTP